MILALIVAVIAAGVARARGGSLDSLAETRLRWLSVLFTALGVQVAFDFANPEWLGDAGDLAIIVVTNAAVIAFLVANRGLPGMGLAALGLLLNLAVISANGAMPVSRTAAEIAGLGEELAAAGIKHEVLGPSTVLPWLADVIPIPGLQKIVSVGDVVLAAGIGRLVYLRTLAGGVEDRDEPAVRGEAASG